MIRDRKSVRESRCGCDLDDLLEVPLCTALALPEVNHRAVDIAENLHLDVARRAG